MPPPPPYQQMLNGARDTFPLLLAAMPFAIVFGALALSEGLTPWAAIAMSLFVFAGASQFITVTLLASSTALPVILLTVFIVNLRHMLYATSLMPHVAHLPQRLRLLMAFGLTDETYAVVSNHINRSDDDGHLHCYYLGSALAMYFNWVFFTAVGILMGEQIPDMTAWGLDVAMIVAFVGIVVPALKHHAHWACAVTAAVSGVLTFDWPNQSGLLLSALLAILVGIVTESLSKDAIPDLGTDLNTIDEAQV